jgi:hypothetical protein
MPRKTKTVVVPPLPGERRDLGKHFLITEWGAERAEDWGLRMMFAFNREAGVLPSKEDVQGMGMEGIALLSIGTLLRGSLDPDTILPLFNQLLECVRIIRDPKAGQDFAQVLLAEDTQDVATRLWLRSEVLALHTNFSMSDALSGLYNRIMKMEATLRTTPTSPPE